MTRLLGPLFAALALALFPARAAGAPALQGTLAHHAASLTFAQLGTRSPEAREGERLMSEAEFERAVRVLQRGVSRADVTDDELVELYRLMGLAYLYLGDEQKARDAYEKLLQARPDYELPRSTAPRIRELYARIREDIRKRRVRPVTIYFEPLQGHTAGQPLEVQARIEDMALGARAKLYYRRAGVQSYSSVEFARDPQAQSREEFRAVVPAFEFPADRRSFDVEYYLEVADAAQRRLAGRGDSLNPLNFTVRAPGGGAEPPTVDADAWYRKPWVWIAGGVVAAGVAGGIAFAATRQPTGDVPVKIRVQP